jgi:uncharacterized repeat protein (TIGR03803 family)
MGLALRTDLLPARQVQDLPPLPSREARWSRLSKRHNGRGPVSGKPEQRCGRLFSGTRLKPGSGRPQHSSFHGRCRGPAAGSGGVLYGSTSAGGPSNYGTVFSLSPPVSPGGAEDWREWHGVQFEAVT